MDNPVSDFVREYSDCNPEEFAIKRKDAIRMAKEIEERSSEVASSEELRQRAEALSWLDKHITARTLKVFAEQPGVFNRMAKMVANAASFFSVRDLAEEYGIPYGRATEENTWKWMIWINEQAKKKGVDNA